jgi:lysozyme
MSKARILVASLTLSASAFVGLAVHEGYRDTAYIPVKGDVPTIGFGDTHGVKPGDKTDPIRALIRLSQHAESFQADLRKCIGDVPMHQHEWDSIVSLAYNVGPGAVCNSSIPRKLKAGQYEAACKTILDFDGMCVKRDPATGKCIERKVLRGLTIRRQSEFRQCMGSK